MSLYPNLVPLALIWFGKTLSSAGAIMFPAWGASSRQILGSLEEDPKMPRDVVEEAKGKVLIFCGWMLLTMLISVNIYLVWFIKA